MQILVAGKCCKGLPTEGPAKPSSCGVPRHKGCCPVRRHWSIARTFREGERHFKLSLAGSKKAELIALASAAWRKSLCFSAWLLREKKVATHGVRGGTYAHEEIQARADAPGSKCCRGSCHDPALCGSSLRSGVLNISNKFGIEFHDESQPNIGCCWRRCGLMEPWIRNPA